jgi:hypothetical protein
MKIGYIRENNLELNPHLTERFQFIEATFTRRISIRGDRVYSKMLMYPIDYEEIVDNADLMKKHPDLILVREPFLLDDELREKVTRWVDWANNTDPSEYDFLAKLEKEAPNANDLISRSALRPRAYHVTDNIIGVERCVVDWEDIEEAPAVDAVEVVRCKDCKHRGTDYCIFHIKGEPADEELLRKLDNDFCSYGERRECDAK